ncbi:MAG: hypothetical protein KGM24_11710, partial [Elusimicrobia bacterium]|nr:hypothetical protein [Elusimicrobiota bacterium]
MFAAANPVDNWGGDLETAVNQTRQANVALAKPGLTPDQRQALVKKRDAGLQGIANVAAGHQNDVQAQIAVTRGYTAVGEAALGRATGDRAVLLAQASGSPKTLSTALAVSAAAYGASGDYRTAASDAKKALDLDGGNRDAAFLYSEYKDRVSVEAPKTPAGGGTGGARAGGG